MKKLTKKLKVVSYDTDAASRMKPSAFMNHAQEAANVHADILGFGYEDLISNRVVWILSRMHIKFYEYPKWRDEVFLSTWHKGPERLFYLRDFLVTSEDGKTLVAATTSWLTLNIDTRRLVRDSGIEMGHGNYHEHAIEKSCEKLQIPKEAEGEFVVDHKVSYSDVDVNEHTNNAMYAVWALDAVDYDVMIENELSEFIINFNHESKPGDIVSIYKYTTEEEGRLVIYIEGKLGDTSSFIVKMIF